MSGVLNNSLTIIGILGILLLFLSFFIRRNFHVVIFTQILSLVSVSILFTISFFNIKQKKDISISMILLFLGSGGFLFTLLQELFLDSLMDKSIMYNIATILSSLGIINYMNNKLNTNETN